MDSSALTNYQRAMTRQDDGSYLLPECPTSILKETKVLKKVARRKSYIPNEDLPKWISSVLTLDSGHFSIGDVFRDYLIFVLFTGVRREEARCLLKENVDLNRKVFRLIDTKNREVVELPLSDWLADFIKPRMNTKGKYLFSGLDVNKPINGFKRPHEYLRKQVGINFTIHDLRRTFITVAESMDISSYTIKHLVNHKISESNDVTAGYIIVDLERMRKATNKISSEILNAVPSI